MARRPKYGPSTWEFKSSQRNYAFKTKIDEIIVNTEARLLAVMRTAISSTVEDAQTPVPKGGKMRVKTGFLRSTGLASLEGPPVGPTTGDKKQLYTWEGNPLNIVLAKMKIGDIFYWGWTAHYAKYREAYDGFLEAALQNWQTHVDAAIAILKSRVKK